MLDTQVQLQLFGAAAALGIISHLSYFKNGEHHLNTIRYTQIALVVAPVLLTLLFSRLQNSSVAAAISPALKLEGAYLSGLWTSMLIYRVAFHRIRSFPGPFSLKLSKFCHVAQIIRKLDGYKKLDAWHETYGDFVRVGPTELSIVHPEAVEAIMGARSSCTKAPWYDMGVPLVSLHQTRSRALHDRRRKVWDRGFSMKALDSYQSRVKGFADVLTEQIASFGGKPLNATRWFNYYSFDVMGELAFGESFNMLKSGERHEAIKLLDEGQKPLGQLGVIPWLLMLMIRVPGLSAGYNRWLEFCEKQVDRRKQMDVKEKDIMSWLLEAEPMDKDPFMHRMWTVGDSRLIIVAGSDTTAATLTHIFYHFCKDKSLIGQLRAELGRLVKEDGSFDVKDLANADFLNGVINETLRLHPPVPSGLSRLTPPEGIVVGDRKIPGDITVSVPLYTMGRSPKAFQKPLEFIPERWYSKPDLILNKTAFAPFSVGRYGCVGKNLALMELRTVTAELVTRFDISFAPNETGHALLNETEDYFTIGLADLMLTFTPRE